MYLDFPKKNNFLLKIGSTKAFGIASNYFSGSITICGKETLNTVSDEAIELKLEGDGKMDKYVIEMNTYKNWF